MSKVDINQRRVSQEAYDIQLRSLVFAFEYGKAPIVSRPHKKTGYT